MAIAVASSASVYCSNASGTTKSAAYNSASGSNRVLVVTIGVTVTDATSVTYNGVALTLAVAKAGTGLPRRCSIWYLINPATGSNTLSVEAGTFEDVQISAVTLTGANQTAPLGGTGTANGSGNGDNTINITVQGSSGIIVGVYKANAGTVTTAGGQTEVANTTCPNERSACGYKAHSGSNDSIVFTSGGGPSEYCLAAAEFKAFVPSNFPKRLIQLVAVHRAANY